jgi:hypothetical protein
LLVMNESSLQMQACASQIDKKALQHAKNEI